MGLDEAANFTYLLRATRRKIWSSSATAVSAFPAPAVVLASAASCLAFLAAASASFSFLRRSRSSFTFARSSSVIVAAMGRKRASAICCSCLRVFRCSAFSCHLDKTKALFWLQRREAASYPSRFLGDIKCCLRARQRNTRP